MSLYSNYQCGVVVMRASEVVQARQHGEKTFTAGGQTFDLEKGGYCNRFVRQVFETSLGLGAFGWYFGDATARATLDKLAPYLLSPKVKLQEGDIIGWHYGCGTYGHIAIYIGGEKKLIAENTSATRGDPRKAGTKVTRLANCRTGWKAYRLFPTDK